MNNLFLRALLLGCCSLLLQHTASAQGHVDQYIETSFNGSFDPDSAANHIVLSDNNDGYGSFTLPFAFSYDNTLWPSGTTMTVNANGGMQFGATTPSNTAHNCVGDFANAPSAVLPFSGDYYVWGGIYWKLTGTVPNRVLTVEWYQYSPNPNPNNTQTGIEVKLRETSNVIEFIYNFHNYVLGSIGGIGLNGSASPYSKPSQYSATGATPQMDVRWTPPACTAVTITSQPASTTVCAGQPASFSVSTAETGDSYQWQMNGAPVGTNLPTYTIAATQSSNAGTYDVIVTNGSCIVTSSQAVLAVGSSLSFAQQPVGATVCAGQPVTLSCSAADTNVTYQWYHEPGHTPIAGETHANYSIPSAQTSDAGNYSVTISSSCGSVASTTVTLVVNAGPMPSITTQPASLTVTAGQNATFSVVAGSGTLTYQWYHNGTAVGTNSPTYSITGVQASDAGSYDVIVSNSSCTVTSSSATLTVCALITLNQQPAGSITPGQSVTFSVSNADSNMTYQWLGPNGLPIAGQTSSSYTIANVQSGDAGIYSVVITTVACGSQTSTVTLAVSSMSVAQEPFGTGPTVRVYPNPSGSFANIEVEELSEGIPASVYVVDETGETVASLYHGNPRGEIGLRLAFDCSTLASGTYYVHVQTAVMGRAVRLVVTR